MSQERPIPLPPAMEKAVNELKGTISKRFPQASFVLAAGAGTAVFFHAERNEIGHPSAWAMES